MFATVKYKVSRLEEKDSCKYFTTRMSYKDLNRQNRIRGWFGSSQISFQGRLW